MNRVALQYLAVTVCVIALSFVAAETARAQMDCLDCHQLHNSPGGTLNTAAEFDLICDTCHGPAGTEVFADRHVDPNARYQNDPNGSVAPTWEMTCVTCHTPHSNDTVNHLYNNGAPHAHTLGGDSGNLVQGLNIKLFGRDEDGTGVAKVAVPLRIISVSNSGSCPNSNTDVQVSLPTFAEGDGPLHTIMIGDRITITNSNNEFNGEFRVKETSWDNFLNTGGSGWVCFDRPNSAAYSGDGFVQSRAWYNRTRLRAANWSAGTATLDLRGDFSFRETDDIEVNGVVSDGPGSYNGAATVSAVTDTRITNATWSGGTATLTLEDAHLYQSGSFIEVSDVISNGPGIFNGDFTVSGTTAATVSYALATDPGAYVNNGAVTVASGNSQIAFSLATDPGASTDILSARIEYVSSTKAVQNMAVVIPPGPPPYLVTNATWTAAARSKDPDIVELTLDRVHPFSVDDVIAVSGINPSGYNGTWTVTATTATTVQWESSIDPGPYVSGGEIPDPTAPNPTLEITLASSNANINGFQAATTGVRDGDIITVSGVDPAEYDGRWEVESVSLPIISVRCPPYTRSDLSKPACTPLAGLPAYSSSGEVQSTGSLRAVVFESRSLDNNIAGILSDYTHGFTNTDIDEDGYMDGPCETCHTETSNHKNDDFGNTHNNSRTCTDGCHSHSVGFDKSNDFCPTGRTCPPTN
jgi:hypothetical protein